MSTNFLAALQTEVIAQEVRPSRQTVWQRWSAVGRQLVERDMKGQVVQVGMIAGVVFMRTLLQVKNGIHTGGQGTDGARHRQRVPRLQLDHPMLMDSTLQRHGMEAKQGTAPCAAEAGLPLLPVQQETVCWQEPACCLDCTQDCTCASTSLDSEQSEEARQIHWARGCNGS